MRLILNKRTTDRLSREELLQKCNMKSVNQMAAAAILLENWRAHRFGIDSIMEGFSKDLSQRGGISYRTTRDPNSFVSVSAKLMNAFDDDFKNAKSIISAKKKVNNFVRLLPVL